MHYHVLSQCVCENRDGWLVAWGLCGCMLIVSPLCGFSRSLFCNRYMWHYMYTNTSSIRDGNWILHILLVGNVPPEWASRLAEAGFALRCWLCCASADVVIRRVYGALLVAMLVVCRVCAESGRV